MHLFSMTGYGRKEGIVGDRSYIIELKSLNGKQFEANFKIPGLLKANEISLRNLLQAELQRGTIDCNIQLKSNPSSRSGVLNEELISQYYSQLKDLAAKKDLDLHGVLSSIIRLPDVVMPGSDILSEKEFEDFVIFFKETMNELIETRKNEGVGLKKDLAQRVVNIVKTQEKIAELEPNRLIEIKTQLSNQISQLVSEGLDNTRFEQEIIFYSERLDIHEEQQRLGQHCKFFMEILDNQEVCKGKKLSFVLQEMGREINTIGSKAYNADIQKLVVLMKDELEKAKEQVNNVL